MPLLELSPKEIGTNYSFHLQVKTPAKAKKIENTHPLKIKIPSEDGIKNTLKFMNQA